MARIEHSIDIGVPVREAYDQWTQFESFPEFMEGVESVNQTDDTHLHWVATVAGKRQEWDAEITEQTPDQRIAWTSVNGDANAGSVDFHRLGEESTSVTLTMDVEPTGVIERIGTALGVPASQVKDDLERFRDFIERRGTATGSWRDAVRQDDVTGSRPTADASTADAGIGERELAPARSMGASRTGMAGDLGAGAGTATIPATADDPYGIGAGTTTDAQGTGSGAGPSTPGDSLTGEMGTGLNDPQRFGTGRRESDLDR